MAMVVGEQLRQARRAAGMTQAELAQRVGVADGTRVAAWEAGRAMPRPATWSAICVLLGIGASESEAVTLRALRLRQGLTHSDVARAIEVDPSTVVRWESGAQRPRAAHAERLAQVLGVDTLPKTHIKH